MNKREEMLKSWDRWHSDVDQDLIPDMAPTWAYAFSEGWERAHLKFPNLQFVIDWLENGCDPKDAAKELRIYQQQIRGY